jgi:class 3 adenylate cyclase
VKTVETKQGYLIVTPLSPPISPRLEALSRGEPMNSSLRSIGSFLRQRLGLMPSSSNLNNFDIVVSGYSLPSEAKPAPVLNRKAVGILYADIVDYARLSELDEEGTHRRLLESMHLMRTEVTAHDGRIAHYAGDAILAEFKDADSALHCAISVQLSARQWNATLPLEQQVRLRIGVNFGDVIVDQGDIYGNAVNLAARLEKLAESGGICVSRSVRSELDNHPSYCFIAMGKRYVKNIAEPVQAYWIECESGLPTRADSADGANKSAVTP